MKVVRFSQRGLVGSWRFDEETGSTAKDSSPYGNHGTIYGATRVRGIIGKALSFDGEDDYVEVNDSESLDITDEITITLWLKRKNNDTSIIFKAGGSLGSGTGSGYRVILDEDNKISFNLRHGSSEDWVTCNSTIPADVFTFIVVTFDGSVAKIYVNSELDKTGYMSPCWTNDVPLRIGHRGWNPNYFNGTIDEVRIYNRALSPGEIRIHYAFFKYIKPHPIIMRRKL